MPPDRKDAARLWDMLDSARTILKYTSGYSYENFLADRKTRDAVERNLEIIGEAARCVSEQTRMLHPGIPWKSIIGLRNILTHDYGGISPEIVWSVVEMKLRPLIRELEGMGLEDHPQSK
ncbi:MAG: DUF86 domain-containing protein [Candidatus Omnitrophica bacterium]|nr:DUF86 domain-containing protein [Candidatus Omnitrophota bacterium]MBV6480694.1 hypothetical protein [bacterium]MBW7938750.1 DUF86 domain-containing protein [Candidatus Omnitrophota bacterium]MCE7908646.1 DUF86 domain-containing protein [Candidatus Omnitrophica bacterium COP1]